MSRYSSTADILPYSDRKLQRNEPPPWSTEDIVAAQCMDCEGKSVDEICAHLGRGHEEVLKLLNNEPAERRPERANVGYSNLKRR